MSESWNARYAEARDAGTTVWSDGPNSLVEQELANLPPGTAIDLATGEGRNARWLAARGWRVRAVDFSDVGITVAREIAAGRGLDIEWVVADVLTWTPPKAVDLVVIAYLHLPRRDWDGLLSRLPGWLAPGGTVFIVGHALENLTEGAGGPQDPDLLYTDDLEVPDLEVVKHQLVRLRRPDGAWAVDRLLLARNPT